MRVAVYYGRRRETVSRFLQQIEGAVEPVSRRRLRVLAFPPERSIVAAIIAQDERPAIGWACRPDGSFAILDGEVYNAADLRGGSRPPAGDDAALLLELYFAGGQEAMARVDAAASIIIWDAGDERLLVFRDRSGIVPSFHAEWSGGLAWASDIATLLCTGLASDINLSAVDCFLANGFVPAPWTLFEHIKKLPPAHLLCRQGQGPVTVRPYWRPTGQPKHRLRREETTERLGQLFEQALRRRFMADPASALLLSGGIDSKLIIAGLRKWLGAEFDTFTIGYADCSGIADELGAGRSTAEVFGTRHHEIIMRPNDIADRLEWILSRFGEPFTWGLRSFKLDDLAKGGVRTVFSGDGGDAWYLGKTETSGIRLARLPAPVRGLLRGCVPVVGRVNERAATGLSAVLWCASTHLPGRCAGRIIPDALRIELYSDPSWLPACRETTDRLFNAAASDYPGESAHDRITFLHRRFFAAECNLYFNHSWGRAHGLAMRLPYHDADVLDFVMRLQRNNTKKTEIRDLAATLMPSDAAYRSKIYQSIPIGHWFRGPLKDFLRDGLAPARVRAQGLLDAKAVERLVQQHVSGRGRHGMRLWSILALLTWLDLINRPLSAASAEAIGHPSRRE